MVMVPDRLNFLFDGADEWWLGDVIERFSLEIDVEIDPSFVINEEDVDDDGRSNKGGGGAGDANSCWTRLVVAAARDLKVIP